MVQQGVSLVVPNWNGRQLLEENLPSVIEATRCYGGETEVIVVDDASSDGSVALVRDAFPSVRLEQHEENRGFGFACLSGALAARHSLLALINSDVRLDPGFLQPLVDAFADPCTFAASPLILGPDGRVDNLSLRVPYLKRGKIRFFRSDAEMLRKYADDDRLEWYTLFPLGGASVVHRERFLELGGFDPLFRPFYFEDQDLGLRAWRRGWCCRVEPSSRVVHASSSTIGRFFGPKEIDVYRKRNRLFLMWKNLTDDRRLRSSFAFQVRRVLLSLLRFDTIQFRGTVAALRQLGEVLERRAEERREAKRSEQEIFATIERAWRRNLELLEGRGQEGGLTAVPDR